MIAAMLFRDHPKVVRSPSFKHLPNTLIFRFSMCMYLLFLEWISVGGPIKVSTKRVRNDMVDMNFAAYATFSTGFSQGIKS